MLTTRCIIHQVHSPAAVHLVMQMRTKAKAKNSGEITIKCNYNCVFHFHKSERETRTQPDRRLVTCEKKQKCVQKKNDVSSTIDSPREMHLMRCVISAPSTCARLHQRDSGGKRICTPLFPIDWHRVNNERLNSQKKMGN